jgi:Lar family restriction alleviation protein
MTVTINDYGLTAKEYLGTDACITAENRLDACVSLLKAMLNRRQEISAKKSEDKGKLKPCPFCGSTDVGIDEKRKTFEVYCVDCGGKLGNYFSEDTATKAWNHRAREG